VQTYYEIERAIKFVKSKLRCLLSPVAWIEETKNSKSIIPGEDNRRQQNQKEETMHCYSVRPEQLTMIVNWQPFTGLSHLSVLYSVTWRGTIAVIKPDWLRVRHHVTWWLSHGHTHICWCRLHITRVTSCHVNVFSKLVRKTQCDAIIRKLFNVK